MTTQPDKLDRASWNRYGKTNTNRCTVCGAKADVRVSLTAHEFSEGRGAPMLVRQTIPMCHDHGILRYGNALRALNGASNNA